MMPETDSLGASGKRASALVMMNAVALRDAIHARSVSCVEVITAYLDHIEKVNPKVNAIVALQDRAQLIGQAKAQDEQISRGEVMGPASWFPPRREGFATGQGHAHHDGIAAV